MSFNDFNLEVQCKEYYCEEEWAIQNNFRDMKTM